MDYGPPNASHKSYNRNVLGHERSDLGNQGFQNWGFPRPNQEIGRTELGGEGDTIKKKKNGVGAGI